VANGRQQLSVALLLRQPGKWQRRQQRRKRRRLACQCSCNCNSPSPGGFCAGNRPIIVNYSSISAVGAVRRAASLLAIQSQCRHANDLRDGRPGTAWSRWQSFGVVHNRGAIEVCVGNKLSRLGWESQNYLRRASSNTGANCGSCRNRWWWNNQQQWKMVAKLVGEFVM
jgi:hypothetical protein